MLLLRNQFCAYHFHDLFDAKVVDIMPIEQTSKEVVSRLYDFSPKIGQVPIILKENPGYTFNAMFIPWLMSACDLVRTSRTPEEINRLWLI